MLCKWFLVVLPSESHSLNLLLILWHILATNSRNKGLVWFLNIIWMCLVQFIFNITLLWIEDNFGKSVGGFVQCTFLVFIWNHQDWNAAALHVSELYLETSPCCAVVEIWQKTLADYLQSVSFIYLYSLHTLRDRSSVTGDTSFFFILTYLLCYKMPFMPTNIIHWCFQGFTKLTEHLYMERVIWEETQVWSARALSGTASCRDD